MKKSNLIYNLWLDFESKEEKLKDVPSFVDLPKNDNDILINLQHEYLIKDNEKAYISMWKSFKLLCVKAVKKEIKQKGFFLDQDEIIYKADIACEYVLRRYKTYPVKLNKIYFIKNFIAAAHDGVFHALYSECENDKYLELCKKNNGNLLRCIYEKL